MTKSYSNASNNKKPLKKSTARGKENLLYKKHIRALQDSWSQLSRSPYSTVITCMVMAMTILLTSTFVITLKTFQHIAQNIKSTNQITLYLKNDKTADEITNWVEELKTKKHVQGASYISPEQALQELSEQSEYKDILSHVEENPLPPVVLVKFNADDKQQMNELLEELKSSTFVDNIHLNFEWMERLITILRIGDRITYALSILFSVGILFIVSHTIQGATTKKQQEMDLMQLIGAPISYIRRPFLYMGTMLGLGAGLITCLLILLIFTSLKQPLVELLSSYHITASLFFINLKAMIYIILFSTFLGWLGALIAFYKYAKMV